MKKHICMVYSLFHDIVKPLTALPEFQEQYEGQHAFFFYCCIIKKQALILLYLQGQIAGHEK